MSGMFARNENKATTTTSQFNMKIFEANLLKKSKALLHIGWLPVAMFIIAVASMYSTSRIVTDIADKQKNNVDTPHKVSVVKKDLTPDEYLQAAEIAKRFAPNLDVSLGKNGNELIIAINNSEHYQSEWMVALSNLTARNPGVLWDAKYLCVGRCQGRAATASITGYRQDVVVQ